MSILKGRVKFSIFFLFIFFYALHPLFADGKHGVHYFLSVREVYNHDGHDEGHYEDNERILYVLFGQFFFIFLYAKMGSSNSNNFLFRKIYEENNLN